MESVQCIPTWDLHVRVRLRLDQTHHGRIWACAHAWVSAMGMRLQHTAASCAIPFVALQLLQFSTM
jgi:hypothetical protein